MSTHLRRLFNLRFLNRNHHPCVATVTTPIFAFATKIFDAAKHLLEVTLLVPDFGPEMTTGVVEIGHLGL